MKHARTDKILMKILYIKISSEKDSKTQAWTILRMLMRLPFLPFNRIEVGTAVIKSRIDRHNLNMSYEDFIKYFEDTWFHRY
jgi:hypothetical protein